MAVNLFLMISFWFLCDREGRPGKALLVWGEVFFYCVVITVLVALTAGGVSVKDYINAFFPILKRPLWFAAPYIFMLLLAPFLRCAFRLPQNALRSVVLIGFAAICVISTLSGFMDTFLDGLLWFIYLFLLVGYYKKYGAQNKIRKEYFLLAALGIYCGLVLFGLAGAYTENRVVGLLSRVSFQYLADYKSIPNVLCAFCLFIYFTKLEMKVSRPINAAASSAFAVYCIHQVPVFYNILWFSVFRIQAWYASPLFIPWMLAAALLLYAACHVIDLARRKWIEPLWARSTVFRFLEKKINALCALPTA